MSKQYPGGIVSKTPVTPTSLSAPGIWTMNQQAAAQATNTWPFPRDPQFKNVTMLLHGDGAAGGVAATGVGAGVSTTVTNFNADASTNNFNVTINGDARSDTFTPYQEGYYSNRFNGSSDYLTVASNAAFQFGTGDFTIELWYYMSATTGSNQHLIDMRGASSSATAPLLYVSTSNLIIFYTNGSNQIANTTLSVSVWYHIALTRSGTTTRLFVNGALSGSVTDTNSYIQSSVYLGRASDAAGGYVNGFESNVRLVKGTAVYTSAFTPSTTPLTAITNTSLLTCQSNRFIDNSSNAFTITVNSTPQVSPAQPFTLPSSVATYGSGYFDGTGDYLSTPTASGFQFGTGDFTVEMWAFANSSSSLHGLVSSNTAGAGYWASLIFSNTVYWQSQNGLTNLFSASYTSYYNQWTHIAFVRSSGTTKLYLNGVQAASAADTTNYTMSAGNVDIGRDSDDSALFNGYLSNVRIVKGTAVYTTAFTPPTAPLTAITNTSILTTQFNGGGNNSGFKDSSQFNFPITRNGNTTQGTFTPYAADWSNYFNGSSYFTIASNSVLNMNTYACLECWVNLSSSGVNQLIIGRDSSYWLAYDFSSIGGSSTKLVFAIYNGSAWQAVSSSTTPAVGTWYHLVGIKDNTTLRIYINGTQENTATFSGTPATGATPFGIASNQNNTNMTGYISNARFNLGSTSTALPYTANFTSSAVPLTAVTGTQLLTCQSNRFVDNSTNALTLSVSGSPSVQGFSPFAPLTVYNPTTYGGSAYFDGSGDYLTIPQNAAFNFGTGAFTVEAFIYITANNGTNERIIGLGDGVNGSPAYYSGWTFNVNSSLTVLSFTRYDGTVYEYNATFTFNINTWYHVVAVRNSSSSFAMYINGTRVYNATVTTSFNNVNSNALNLAYQYDGASPAGVKYFNGYISNPRIVNGSAVYDPTVSTLTVPTAPLTAITGTSFLLSGTNPAILDNAMVNNLETVGNASVSTAVKKYGAASMYFDGTGDYLLLQGGQNFTFSTGDFTIEMWIYVVSGLNADIVYYDGRPTSTNGLYNIIYTNSTGKLVYSTNSADRITGTTTLSTGTWYHIAVCRSGTSTKLFLSGTQEGSTYTDSNSYIVGANRPVIGGNGYTLGNALLNGYIDDLRITKAARYTTTFTVPDQAFPNG
jgi:hypothetical protein